MSDMIFQINSNGSRNTGILSGQTKTKKKNCSRPGGFLWGSRGNSCSC